MGRGGGMGLPSHSKKVVHMLPQTGELNRVYLHMGPNTEFGNLCSAVSMYISKDADPYFHATTGPFSCIPGMQFSWWGNPKSPFLVANTTLQHAHVRKLYSPPLQPGVFIPTCYISIAQTQKINAAISPFPKPWSQLCKAGASFSSLLSLTDASEPGAAVKVTRFSNSLWTFHSRSLHDVN